MNNLRTILPMALLMTALGALHTHAAVIIDHTGAADPTTEGWAQTSGGGTSATALSPDGATGFDAWQTSDTSSSAGSVRFYAHTLAPSELTDATTLGWRMSATLRLPTADQSVDEGVSFDFGVTNQIYRVIFGTSAGGDTIVAPGRTADNPTQTTITGLDYHTYSLTYDPNTDKVAFAIDGVVEDADVSAFTPNIPGNGRARFGALGSGSTGVGNWHSVTFEIIPEPASMALMALGACAMLRRQR